MKLSKVSSRIATVVRSRRVPLKNNPRGYDAEVLRVVLFARIDLSVSRSSHASFRFRSDIAPCWQVLFSNFTVRVPYDTVFYAYCSVRVLSDYLYSIIRGALQYCARTRTRSAGAGTSTVPLPLAWQCPWYISSDACAQDVPINAVTLNRTRTVHCSSNIEDSFGV